jgi:hypothetical protein
MAWKDNALGIVVDRTMDVDYAMLKSQGISFVIIEAATGWDVSQVFTEQYNKAVAAKLPVIVQYLPISAVDDYTFEAPAREEIEVLKKALGAKAIAGLVISMERYWVGWDVEQAHNPIRSATATAIAYTAKTILETMTAQYQKLGIQVMVRTNDNFVQKYAPDIAQWSDKFGFVLADWRFRTRDANGAFTVYNLAPKVTASSVADIRAALPADTSKNPLVPGNTPQLKFWEFNGTVTMPVSLVKGWDGKVKMVKAVLFNGSEEAMKTYLGITEVIQPVDPPVDPLDPQPLPPGDLSKVMDVLNKISVDVSSMAQDIHSIRAIFRE